MEVTIVDIDEQHFSINGVPYLKNFLSIVTGDNVEILNAYDSKVILQKKTDFSEYTVDAASFASAALLQAALVDVLFRRIDQSLIDDIHNSLKSKPETGRELEMVGGVIRNNAGTWEFIEDSGHYGSSGFASIVTGVTGEVTLFFEESYQKIVTFLAVPDETFAAKGVIVGSSVSLAGGAVINLYSSRTLGDYVYYDGANFISANGIFGIGSYAAGVLTLTHETAKGLGVSVSDRDSSTYINRVGSISGTTVQIKFYDFAGVQYTGAANTGMKFFITRPSDGKLSNTDSAIVNSNLWVFGVLQK